MFARIIAAGLLMLAVSMAINIGGQANGGEQGQNVPNLSGTWELIEFDGTRKVDDITRFPKLTLVVSQTATEIRITQKTIRRGTELTQEFTYYADGRGETNFGRIQLWAYNQSDVESVTEWSKDKLLTRYKQRRSLVSGHTTKDLLAGVKEEWQLASDDKTLVLKTSHVQTEFPSISGSSNVNAELAPKASFHATKLKFKKVS